MKKNLKKYVLGSICVVLFGFLFSFRADLFQISKNIEIFISIYKEVNEKYVDEVSPYSVIKKGIDAMLSSLDPYTVYFPESEMGNYRMQYVNDSYGGIGATTFVRKDKLIFSDIFENSPADKVDLRVGDSIKEIDNIKVTKNNLNDISDKLKGGRSTEIKIVIERDKTKLTKTIKRDKILIPSVNYYDVIDGDTAYIALNRFVEHSTQEIVNALQELKNKNFKHIILDLRNNGGGLLNEAVKIVNLFVPAGQIVVTQQGRYENYYYEHRTLNDPFDKDIPLVVLINKNSASASEVVAGALQDLDRAVIIGKKSFGKALVQQTVDMPYNSLLKITIAKYYTPSGRCLQSIDYSNHNDDGSYKNLNRELSNPYFTKNKREIFNAGGVAPDILIEDEILSETVTSLYSNFLVFDFCNQYRNSIAKIEPVDNYKLPNNEYEKFKTFVLDKKDLILNRSIDNTLQRLNKQLKKEEMLTLVENEYNAIKNKIRDSKAILLEKNKKAIIHELESNIIKRFYFQKGMIKYELKSDPYILEALKVFENSKKMDSILKGEEKFKFIGKIPSKLEDTK